MAATFTATQEIANQVNNERAVQGITIAEIARRTNIDKKRLWYIFNGQREMRVDEFLKLCGALKIDPRNFVTREMVDEVAEG